MLSKKDMVRIYDESFVATRLPNSNTPKKSKGSFMKKNKSWFNNMRSEDKAFVIFLLAYLSLIALVLILV